MTAKGMALSNFPAEKCGEREDRVTRRNEMISTFSIHEICFPQSMMGKGDRYWSAAMLPVADGIFLIDIAWSAGGTQRIRSLVCPASLAGIAGMHTYEADIRSLLYISSPNQDGSPRDDPVPVDAIGIGQQSEDGFREFILVRTYDGQWHPCVANVDIAKLDGRRTLLTLERQPAASGTP